MPGRVQRVLGDNDIAHILVESDIEDYVPSDEDLGDAEFLVENEEESSSSSESSTSEEERQSNFGSSSTSNRGRASGASVSRRTRGRNLRQRASREQRGASTSTPGRNRSSASGSTSEINWYVTTFLPKTMQLIEPSYLPIEVENFEIIQYFKQYIDDEIVTTIVMKTNQTAVLKTGKSLDLTVAECFVYFGICLAMASINYPQLRMYWQRKFRVALIANAMSRNRFLALRNSLKLVFDDDVTTKEQDKLWRVRPLINKIQSACRAQLKEQCLSIDEMIIPFTGNCGIRIYCPGKPNPLGIKAYVLANPNGMICDFHIYQGSTTYAEFENTNFGQAEKAVLALTETLVPGHIIYCDRYFTSETLLNNLLAKGLGCTGTLMKNRIPKEVRGLLMSDKELKRRGRGSSHVVVRKDDNVSVTKWFDNKPVILMSSVEAISEEDTCQRWSKQERRYMTVNRPRCVRQYNKNMGGVDLADRLLAVCPNRYRTRKWTQRFISHMIDLSVSNAWLLYKKDAMQQRVAKIPQLRQFKLELGELLIEKYQENTHSTDSEEEAPEPIPLKRRRGMPSVPLPSLIQRKSQAKHLPTFSTIQGRCRECHENKTFFECSACNVRLCLTKKRNCFQAFHSR